MPRLFLHLTITLGLVMLLLIGLSRAVAYDESYSQALRQFLLPDTYCAAPCFLGLHNAQSSRQMLATLQGHAWVSDIHMTGSGLNYHIITWDWNGQQPAFIHPGEQGRLQITYDYIDYIHVGDHFTLGDVWLALGPPDAGLISRQHSFVDYAHGHFSLRLNLNCRHFWQASGVLLTKDSILSAPYDLKHLRRKACHIARENR